MIVLYAGIAKEANLGYLRNNGLRFATTVNSNPKELPKGEADQILELSQEAMYILIAGNDKLAL